MVLIVDHDPVWALAYRREAATLTAALKGLDIRFHHIGSTAVPGLKAKPIIDMLGVCPDLAAIDSREAALAACGYEAMGAYGIDGRRYFRKTDAMGRRTNHLHVFATGSPHVARHLAFRDYLRAHPEVAGAYGALKARLTAGPGTGWESYMDGKDAFMRHAERAALAWAALRA